MTKEWLLKKYHIALWDVLDSAVRESSSDKDLMDERPNDLPRYLEEYPNIKLLLFHSNGAYKYFKRFFKNTAIPYICVSSPQWTKQKRDRRKSNGVESRVILCHSSVAGWFKIGMEEPSLCVI